MSWKIHTVKKKTIKNPTILVGMPGIGNIGKIAADFIIDEIKAEKVAEFHGTGLPHSVFVDEDNLVELPIIEIYAKRVNGTEYVILTGDVQPIDEKSCYEFCMAFLEQAKKWGTKKLISIGGIALKEEPLEPKVYCTGTDKKTVKAFVKGTPLNPEIYGVVGPIIGVTGLVIGLGKRYKIDSLTILAETYGHPMYIGITGAKEVLKILKKKLKMPMNLKQLDEEIKKIEAEVAKKTKEISQVTQKNEETKYIG